MLLDKISVFDIVLIVLAVIGLIAVLGVAGMWVMHTGMIHDIGSCYMGGGVIPRR